MSASATDVICHQVSKTWSRLNQHHWQRHLSMDENCISF